MKNWSKLIMRLAIASLFTGCLVYFTRKEKPTGNGFLDIFATTKPCKSPQDLFKVVHSGRLEKMNNDELVDLLNEMVITLVQPRLGSEELINVKSLLFAPIVQLQANGVPGGNGGRQQP